ncbi:MAG: ATP-binding cassette domain-containing protein, partial [Lachnospiraceae bacterium]|nr:ATP-binding cassette domain-containing protein [Lachnospiraceae bacterium]
MSDNNNRKVLLSLKDVDVKFNVRGRVLQAIRNVSLDIYENESLAIVGESGSGKSVLTKTFAGMLDSNGFISNGSIILSDDEISKTDVLLTDRNKKTFTDFYEFLNKNSVLERGASEYNQILSKKRELESLDKLSPDEEADFAVRLKKAKDDVVDTTNYLWSLDKKLKSDKPEIEKTEAKIKELEAVVDSIAKEREDLLQRRKAANKADAEKSAKLKADIEALKVQRQAKISRPDSETNPYGLTDAVLERNKKIAYELLLSIGRYPFKDQLVFRYKLKKAFKLAMTLGEDLNDPEVLNRVFETVAFRVEFSSFDEATKTIHGYAIVDCSKIKYTNDWQQIRGCRIATVFQDPMTSLNPVIPIGKQIMTVILKHQKCSQEEAKKRTIDIMDKVGIPDAEKRFGD